MSKKKHSKTQQLLEQKRILQQQLVSSAPSTETVGTQENVKSKTVLVSEPIDVSEVPIYQPVGLTRTLISTAIIAVLLVGSVITNRQTDYLKVLGNHVFNSLKLSQ